jgi:hypothetical protein
MFFVTAGETDQTIDVFLQDSSSSTGGGLTGLTHASSGLTCYYRRGATGTVTQLTLASQTVGGAHTDGGFVELDSTNAPGTYRLDLSDAMVSTEGTLTIYLHGATNLLQTPIRVHVASATRGYAGTALPDAVADNAGGLVISDAGGLDVDTYLGRITGNVALASSLPSNFSSLGINASGHVSQVTLVDTTTTNTDMVDVSSLATASSIAALNNFDPLTQTVTTDSASRTASQADVSALATAASISALNDFDPATQTVTTDSASRTASQADVSALATASSIAALNDFDPTTQTVTTDSASRTASQADVSALATAASISALNDFDPLTQTVTTDSASRTASQADVSALATAANLATVDTVVDDIKAVTDNLPDSGALSSLATAASISALNDFDPTTQTVTTDSASRTASQADVSALATAASISALNDFDPTTQTVTTDSASRTASQADVSALATAANLATVDTVVDDIKAVTDNLPDSGALSSLATASSVSTVDTVVDAIKISTDKLDDTLELDGSEYRFTTNALEQAPTGGGSAPTEAEIYTYFTASSREDAFKADVSALATASSIAALNDFDPTTQTVTTDSASRTASQADVSSLATAASISALNDFDPTTQTVTTDSASRTASQADVSALATAASISALNDFDPATQTVTTDSASRTASQADVSALATAASISALNDLSSADVTAAVPTAAAIYTEFTNGSNEDVFKADVSALATSASIAALNDLSSADVTAAVPTVGETADAVWDEALSGHNVAGSTGKAIRQVKEGTITIEASIDDTSATTTSFVTNLTESTTSFYSNKIMVFISGSLSGQARIITNYNGTTKAITLEEALTSAPADGDEFLILATHENSIEEIQSGLATAAALATVDTNVDAILVDTGTTLPATLTSIEGKVDTVDTVIDAVKLKTDLIPADFTNQWGAVYDVQITGITTTVEGVAGKHSVAGTVMMSTNASLSSGILTAKKPSDDTTFQTYTVTTSESADNITGVS